MGKAGTLERAGGQNGLIALIEGTPTTANAEHYARIVREKSIARRLIALCADTTAKAHDGPDSIARLLAEHTSRAYDLAPKDGQAQAVSLAEALDDAMAHAARVRDGTEPPGLMTGFAAVDRAMGGFAPGDLVTLAGDTSSGKTALAGCIAANIAQAGGRVLIVSREMQARELAKRLLQSAARVHGQRIRFARGLHEEDWRELGAAAEALRGLSIAIDTRSGTVADIALEAGKWSATWGGPLSLIVVDYLQLMKIEAAKGENRAGAVGRFAWGLKGLAMDLSTPILMLSQLNRAGVIQGRPPNKHDLKESGDLENHSNAVLLLHRPADARPDPFGKFAVWCKVDKARDALVTPWTGPGAVRLAWQPAYTRFDPIKETP